LVHPGQTAATGKLAKGESTAMARVDALSFAHSSPSAPSVLVEGLARFGGKGIRSRGYQRCSPL
jgi:hypothetical protein